ncbi:hypothetical protein RD110_20785 [Rhodoferax koreense]|uniref:Uncharacterized protein n=1 Tax=Rhodoferax koreensis TaxID=1842727 RepID=A0A1P8K031_9BURK|nr:hypothetical protein [Rhodoferax koreense]APW39352.1 hypothetical protein RD110_20785 [Rhodoferax koreense]
MQIPFDHATDSGTASANQALLDALKCEVDEFLESALTERFTVASPNGGLRTEVREIPMYLLPERENRISVGMAATAS